MRRAFLLLCCLIPALLCAADHTAQLNNGVLRIFIDNNGSYAFDIENALLGGSGLFFPPDNPIDLMAGAGIWVAGKVGDEWRVTLAGGSSEFVPGPAYTYDTLGPEYPVFRIARGDNQDLNDDYRQWPALLGGPVDLFGRPQVTGGQSAFTVFSDTYAQAHDVSIGGSPPLGVEGRLYAYQFDDTYQLLDTMLSQVVILDYSITNVTDSTIDSCILTLYADPDIGYSRNDLFATDSAHQGAYLYQPNNFDTYFGYDPPVVGLTMLTPGISSSNYYELFSQYDTLTQTVYLMRGLDLNGVPYLNPTTGTTTAYPFGGNPVDSSGWLEDEEADYRILINLPPQTLAPGETLNLKAALIVAQGSNVLNGITRWRETADLLHSLESAPPRPAFALADANVISSTNPDLRGADWGGRFLDGGIDLASRYFGIDGHQPLVNSLKAEFNSERKAMAYRYVQSGVDWVFADQQVLPLRVTDGTGLDYEVGWLDQNGDGLWTNVNGEVEPLLLFDLTSVLGRRTELTDDSWSNIVGNVAAVVQLDNTPEEVQGSVLQIDVQAMLSNFAATTAPVDFGVVPLGTVAERSLRIVNQTKFAQQVNLAVEGSRDLTVQPASVDLGPGETGYMSLRYLPEMESELSCTLVMSSLGYGLVFDTLQFAGAAGIPPEGGDLNNNGEIDLGDLVAMIRVYYSAGKDYPLLSRCDSDCDADFDLSDIMRFINHYFYGTELTCR